MKKKSILQKDIVFPIPTIPQPKPSPWLANGHSLDSFNISDLLDDVPSTLREAFLDPSYRETIQDYENVLYRRLKKDVDAKKVFDELITETQDREGAILVAFAVGLAIGVARGYLK